MIATASAKIEAIPRPGWGATIEIITKDMETARRLARETVEAVGFDGMYVGSLNTPGIKRFRMYGVAGIELRVTPWSHMERIADGDEDEASTRPGRS